MPKDLILNSLEIQRFRCFRELRIGHLGRVNLIVGKNNVGKSTLLEALRLFASPASFADLLEIFATRNENEIAKRIIPFHFVGPSGLGLDDVEKLWDEVSQSPLEQEVITAMRIISPEVERVAMRTPDVSPRDVQFRRDTVTRIPFVKIESYVAAIPLHTLDDGANRLFGIALALALSKDGMLLVDEIENGIHYSVHADLWRLVFVTAARLNIQVFATTHSYDCIKAFAEAARESEEDGVLVRLARKGDRTLVGEFDERELEIAVEGEIEVR
jgi:AAA15 family ATPase/GTPase